MAGASGIPADTTALISIAFEWGLYGLSVMMFGATLTYLWQRAPQINWTMVVVTCLFFVLSTAHCIVDLVRLYQGFISERDIGPPLFFANPETPIFVAKSALYLMQTLLGDGIVIYRSYMVWQKKWIIILPMMLWCSVATCGSVLLYLLSNPTGGGSNIFALAKWINSYFASSLAANLLSTALLAFRIWQINKQTARYQVNKGLMMPVIRCVVDSGALYSVTLTVALITFVCNSNSQYIVIDMLVPIIAIAFYMIIIRLHRRTGNTTSRSGPTSAHSNTPYSQNNYSQNNYAMRPVQVHISQLSETAKEDAELRRLDMERGYGPQSGWGQAK